MTTNRTITDPATRYQAQADALEAALVVVLTANTEMRSLLMLYGNLVEAMCDIEVKLPDTVILALTTLRTAHEKAQAARREVSEL